MKTLLSKIVLLVGSVCLFSVAEMKAQKNVKANIKTTEVYDYNNALGVRFGGTTGLSFKHRFQTRHASEWILGTSPHAFGITGLYEYYYPTTVEGLNLYVGAGGHISRAYNRGLRYYYVTNDDRVYYYKTYGYGPIVGIDGIGGIEYKIPKAPVAISLDMKPYIEFYRDYSNFNLDPGLGVKFAF